MDKVWKRKLSNGPTAWTRDGAGQTAQQTYMHGFANNLMCLLLLPCISINLELSLVLGDEFAALGTIMFRILETITTEGDQGTHTAYNEAANKTGYVC